MKRSSGLVALLLPPLLLSLLSLLSQRRNKLVTATNRRLLDPVPENVLEDNRVFTGCGVAERENREQKRWIRVHVDTLLTYLQHCKIVSLYHCIITTLQYCNSVTVYRCNDRLTHVVHRQWNRCRAMPKQGPLFLNSRSHQFRGISQITASLILFDFCCFRVVFRTTIVVVVTERESNKETWFGCEYD